MKTKYGLPLINAAMYDKNPDHYILRSGEVEDAPSCPFGNQYKYVVYDEVDKQYVRVTKSVFKKLIQRFEP